jgi:hypothetical protein
MAVANLNTADFIKEGSNITFTVTDEGRIITIASSGGGGGGSGDVVGPSSATDGYFALWDTTTGKLLKDSTYSPASLLAAAESYADGLVVGLWDDRGSFDASGGAYPSTGGSGTAGAVKKGDVWTISVAGTLPTGQVVEVGDIVRAIVDTPGNTQANWAITQNNIGYTAENASNKSSSYTVSSTTTYANTKALVDGLATKQDTLVSGTNIKTINSVSVLGSGDITISTLGAWSLANGGTLSGVNTITSNTANQLVWTGSFTATANSQYHSQFGGTLTARSTTSDTLFGYRFTPTLIAAANTQSLRAVHIEPTFTNGAFTGITNYALSVTGSVIITNPSDTTRTLVFDHSSNTSRITAQSSLHLFANSTNYIQMGGGVAYSSLLSNWDVSGYLGLGSNGSSGSAWRMSYSSLARGTYSNAGSSSADGYLNTSNGIDVAARVNANIFYVQTGNGASSSARNAGNGGDYIFDIGRGGTGTGFANGVNGRVIFRATTSVSTGDLTSGFVGVGVTPTYTLHVRALGANHNIFSVEEDGGGKILEIIEASATKKIGFFAVAPVAQQAGLTAITHTAPGTPDYAIQDLIDSSSGAAFGFATKDEGNTVLSVIKAMHDAMKNYGLLT